MIQYVTYVLYNINVKQFYIGYTSDLERRIKEHKKAVLHHRNKEFTLIFYEAFTNKKDAKRREKYLKTTQGRRMLRLVLRSTLEKV